MKKMIWKIIFLLAFLNVSVKAPPKPAIQIPGEEYLEEMYDKRTVKAIDSLPTLEEPELKFVKNDIELLSDECYPNGNRLTAKKVSVEKYRQKMQAIQCINGLIVLTVLDKLMAVYDSAAGDIWNLKYFLRAQVSGYLQDMTNMLSVLNMAKWDAHDWQVEIFAFLEGLFAVLDVSDRTVNVYKVHFAQQLEKRVREKVSPFVDQCLQQEYITYRGTDQPSSVSALKGYAKVQMEIWRSKGALDAYGYGKNYTVQHLMLRQLHKSRTVISGWANNDTRVKLQTSYVQSQLADYAYHYEQQYSNHLWQLDPIGGNKYNALILKCIYLRLMFFAWVHLRTYHVFRGRWPSVDKNSPIATSWKTLVEPLTRALRVLGHKENIYWSALHVMRDDYKNISNDKLKKRENFMRANFCRTAEDLGLASESVVDRQLQEIRIPEEHESMYKSIETNAEILKDYIDGILFALIPVDGTFIRILVSAEGNKTFVERLTS